MDELCLSAPHLSLKSKLTTNHPPTHTHKHTQTHSYPGQSKHKRLLSHPSNFGDVEQFPKRFMDSLIMQQQKQEKNKQT